MIGSLCRAERAGSVTNGRILSAFLLDLATGRCRACTVRLARYSSCLSVDENRSRYQFKVSPEHLGTNLATATEIYVI
jgi:hypothetical protein